MKMNFTYQKNGLNSVRNVLIKNVAIRRSLKITAVYVLFGCLWILLSDYILDLLIVSRSSLILVSTFKGCVFVAISAALIFALIHPAFKELLYARDTVQNTNSYLVKLNNELSFEKERLLESENMLKETDEMLRAIFDQAAIGIAIGYNKQNVASDYHNRASVNSKFQQITGRTAEELSNIGWDELTHPDDLPEDIERFEEMEAGKIVIYEAEKRLIKPDGSEVWVRMTISPLYIGSETNYSKICLIEDISRQKQIEKSLLDSERSKTILLDNLPGMAYRCKYDRDWTMQFVSQGCYQLTGYKSKSLLRNNEKSFNDLIIPKYRDYLWEKWTRVLNEGTKFTDEFEIMTATGDIKWVWEQGQGIYDANDRIVALEGLIIDITARKQQEMQLKYYSEHDIVTGLYNRRYFENVILKEIERVSNLNDALILVNFENFGNVKVLYGFVVIENLIKEVANRLQSRCTDQCQLYQVSVDQFAYHVKSNSDGFDITAFSASVIEMLDIHISPFSVQAAIGIVDINKHKDDLDNILKFATIASERAFEENEFKCLFFDKKMEEAIDRRESIKKELKIAAACENNKRLYMEYQPVVSAKTGKIAGFEALARFKSEKYGQVSPGEFIPIAEETKLIVPLGKQILKKALQFTKRLESEGHGQIVIAVNISSVQLLRDDFVPELFRIIDEEKVAPKLINLEITESGFSDNYQLINDKLALIQSVGIKISIDDFGTGYSSLARERELNVNCLKIDRFFIDKLLSFDDKQAITADIISMAHRLGHCVIAEGVEDELQKQYLLEHNCDYMQGFLFSKPLPQEAAINLLSKNFCM